MENLKVPFVNLSAQYKEVENQLIDALRMVGNSGVYISGNRLLSFEKKIAEYCDSEYAIGVANGSDAIFLILKALGIGKGDEVITAANSFIATAWVIVATGATPVFADVDDDMNISPESIRSVITKKTKAIIPVHLTGRPAKIHEINEIANQNNIYVVEDSAQAIGARYRSKRVGSFGIAAGFSLHPLKNLGVYGDGGVITTSNSSLDSKLRKLRNHGLKNRDECQIWGYNSRLDELQAAFAEIKLNYLDEWNSKCKKIATTYSDGISNVVKTPIDMEHEDCVYHNFVIRTDERDSLMTYMLEKGIETRIHYPIPIHLQECAKDLGYKIGDFPWVEKYSKQMISLPIYPDLKQDQILHVIYTVNNFFQSN
jgi:dTDP-4-amino-4,6-dideoxygalactose transaminase